jgi:hypothetical protein
MRIDDMSIDQLLVRIPPYRDRPFRLNVTVCSG